MQRPPPSLSRLPRWLPGLLMLVSAPAAANPDLMLPDCAAVEAWSGGYTSEGQSQLTPAVRLSDRFRDATLQPLFGPPLLQWQADRFRAVGEHLGVCADAADAQGKLKARDTIRALQKALIAARTPVRRIGLARTEAYRSVTRLLATATDSTQLPAINEAIAALQGREPRGRLAGMPDDSRQAITTIAQQRPYLLAQDTEALGTRLAQAREQLQEQGRKAAIKALAALEQARAELDALSPDSADALVTLDGLQRHPALSTVEPAEARAFLLEVGSKRELALGERQRQGQQAATAELAAAGRALETLPLRAASLADLDRMARLPALRSVPPQTANEFVARIEQKRRAVIDAMERERVQRSIAVAAELHRTLEQLPLDEQGQAGLDQLARQPRMAELSRAQTDALYRAIAAKRRAIADQLQAERERQAAAVVERAIAALGDPEQGRLEDLGSYRDDGAATAREIEQAVGKPAAQQYWQAFNRHFADHATARLPQFSEALRQLPATLDGLARLRGAVPELTGIAQASVLPRSFDAAVAARARTLLDEAIHAACLRQWVTLGMDAEDASLPLWTGEPAITTVRFGSEAPVATLGDLSCALSDAGHPVHAYDDPGLFSSTHRLNFTRRPATAVALSLHPAALAAAENALIGYEVEDATGERELTPSQWRQYLVDLLPLETGRDDCAAAARGSRSGPGPDDAIARAQCHMKRLLGHEVAP